MQKGKKTPHRLRQFFTASWALVLLSVSPVAGVEFSLKERVGIGRTAEPVTFGVPLAQGLVRSAQDLVLSLEGNTVPAEFRPVDLSLLVRAEGRLRPIGEKKNERAAPNTSEDKVVEDLNPDHLHYICRLYFYRNSPIVRVVCTVENRDTNLRHRIPLQGLHLELPLAITGEGPKRKSRFHFGRPGGDVSGAAIAPAWVAASNSTSYRFGGAAGGVKGGNSKAEKSSHLGWTALEHRRGTVAVGLRDFWQMHPSTLEWDGPLLRIGLIPQRLDQTVYLYAGVARTHTMQFAFVPTSMTDSAPADSSPSENDPRKASLASTDSTAKLRQLVAGVQSPLLPLAKPEYYCRGSAALGKLVERNPRLYPPERRKLVSKVESELDAGLRRMLLNPPSPLFSVSCLSCLPHSSRTIL